MADAEREGSYYIPGGIPITPQARKFGYEFPVYVSDVVWAKVCVAIGIPSRHNTNLEKRIWHLLQYCYEGMAKKLAAQDDFLYYDFKAYYWSRERPNAKKMIRWKLGARLMLDPSTDGPWLYIFAPNVDSIDMLVKGEPIEACTDQEDVPQVGDNVDLGPELEGADAVPDGRTGSGNDEILPDPEPSENST